MHWRVVKYLSPFSTFLLAYLSFTQKGWVCFLPLIWVYAIIPLIELLLRPDEKNLADAEIEIVKKDRRYDYVLYATVVVQYALLIIFLFSLQEKQLSFIDYAGRISSMGLLCGIFGINVGHELGHRSNRFEQILAKSLLLTSLYMHFFIEHNKGHHKQVATPNDPASARLDESLYHFYPRTIWGSYLSAWKIANRDTKKRGRVLFSLANEMVLFTIIQLVFLEVILFLFGWPVAGCFILAAAMGIALLEAVNYIEHYGLSRKEIAPGKYERTMPEHSWNSNHVLGRLLLFELSRHSDHHYLASKKYPLLQHYDHAPQMPTGYPGMMILAHFPPLFKYVMGKQLVKYGIPYQRQVQND